MTRQCIRRRSGMYYTYNAWTSNNAWQPCLLHLFYALAMALTLENFIVPYHMLCILHITYTCRIHFILHLPYTFHNISYIHISFGSSDMSMTSTDSSTSSSSSAYSDSDADLSSSSSSSSALSAGESSEEDGGGGFMWRTTFLD